MAFPSITNKNAAAVPAAADHLPCCCTYAAAHATAPSAHPCSLKHSDGCLTAEPVGNPQLMLGRQPPSHAWQISPRESCWQTGVWTPRMSSRVGSTSTARWGTWRRKGRLRRTSKAMGVRQMGPLRARRRSRSSMGLRSSRAGVSAHAHLAAAHHCITIAATIEDPGDASWIGIA